MSSTNRDDTDIAVVGISAILASGENLYENWESIRQGLDHVSDLPADRVDVTAYFNPDKTVKDHVYCKRGYFIPDYELDPRDYGLNFNQVEDSDANQLLTLLKVKEALSDAKIHPVSKERRNVGVVLGIGGGQKASHEFYSRLNYVVMEKVLRKMGMPDEDVKAAVDKYKSQFPEWRVDSFPGFLGNVTAGRCCNVFNLDGMNCVVDAACASSLIALKVAIDELLHGDCDTMVCGATCTDNSLGMYMAFSKTPVFSTDPHVRAYDESTKGMLIGEGSVMMVLKKLSKAIADGDEIHGVIRGVASSSDGKAPGIYVPTVSGQELCIERAWNKVGADMKTCTLLEGHGTGTPVGDKIELTGMRNQFQNHAGCAKEQIAVGSIKSQVGHTKAVAGFAGLVKVLMALKHKVLPMTINVHNPPHLMDGTDMTETCLYVNLKNRPWFVPREIGVRRAGISSFGFGGANYHMVVEEYEQEHTKAYRMHEMALPIIVHAPTAKDLVAELRSVVAKLEPLVMSGDKIQLDQAYDILIEYRKEHEIGAKAGAAPSSNPRVGLLASDKPKDFVADLKTLSDAIERDPNAVELKLRADLVYRSKGMDLRGKVAALFAGQGSQYLNMYEDVAMNWPEFRQAVVDMDRASSQVCGVRASAFMYPRAPYQKEGEELVKKQEKEISTVQNAQLAITAVSIGGFSVFQRAGFKPDFVGGHSLGEYAAMYACGALDRAEVCELVCARAHAMQNAFQKGEDLGRMIAVVGDNVEAKVRPEAEGVWVANMNSPNQVVLTGTQKGIEQDSARLTALGFKVVSLNTGGAFHSPKMAPAERVFYERLAAAKIHPIAHDAPRAYANVSGAVYPAGDAEEVRRTLAKQMTSSVQFTSQIRQMYKDGARVFVEFGPKNVLAKLVQQILPDANDIACVALNPSPNRSADQQLREAAIHCAVLGVPFGAPFDPWGKRNPFKGIGGYFNDKEADIKARQSKTRVKLSAATYVSKKTSEERQRMLNDGRLLTCFTRSSPRNSADPEAAVASQSMKEELARLRSQLEDAKREAAEKKLEAEKLKSMLESSKASSSDNISLNQKLHLEQLLRNYEDLTKQIKASLTGASPAPVSQTSSLQVAPMVPLPPVTAAPVQPSASSMDRASIETILKAALGDLTGFDVGLVTMDLSLEDDLGIDSIKRVEFVSNVSAKFGVTVGPESMDKLARTRLVGEVVDVFVSTLGASSSKGAAAPVAVAQPVPAKTTAASTGGFDRKFVSKTLNKVLSASTGFSEDLITEDMSLEDDLGVDSIKRVELVSAASADLNVTVSPEAMTELSRSRTVGDVINAFFAHVGGSAAPAPVVAKPASITTVAPVAPKPAAAGGFDRAYVEKTLKNVLATSTGFDESMLTMDLNLEEDLGIDSIKRVEFVSNVSALFNITVGPEAMDKLARTRLVGEVVDVFLSSVAPSSASAPVSVSAPVVASVPAPASSSGGFDRNQVTKTLQKVLAASTGFSEDLISDEMSLEDDLGVDSIKRVELVSAASSDLNVTVSPEAMTELSRSRTVGDVINAFFNHVGGSKTSAPVAIPSAPVPSSASVAKPVAPVTASAGMDRAHVEKILKQVLSGSTGFDESMLTMDLNLEEDLGIDSIKRVEFVSNVSAMFNITVGPEAMDKLARTRLVGEVVEVFVSSVAPSSSAAAPTAVVAASAPVAASPVPVAAPSSSSNGMNRAQVTQVLQKVLSESTGFAEDLITEDMSLEDDLGVDSIKRVELVSSASASLQINVSPQAMTELSRSRTVGEVITAFFTHVGAPATSNGSSGSPADAGAGSAASNVKPLRASDCNHLTLTYADAVVIAAPDRQSLERPNDRPTLIIDDGTGLAYLLAEKLGASAVVLTTTVNGKKAVAMKDYSEASFEQALVQVCSQFGKPGGFVFLPSASQDVSKQNAFAMLAAKLLKPYLADLPIAKGRCFFIGVARMDGKLGLGGCADVKVDDVVAIAERGAIFGLCKTLDLEWPHVFARGVDLDVKLSNDKCCEYLLRELDDPNLNLREVGYCAADLKRRTTKAVPLVPTAQPAKPKISKSDVFIVTGGARGITPLCVAEIARQAQGGTFFLLGRSKIVPEPAWAVGKATGKALDDAATVFAKDQFAQGKGEKPTPKVVRALSNGVEATREIAESLTLITAAGGKAEYISADVSNPDAVTKALQGRAGSVTGLIHASGVLRDKMIQNKTMDDFEAVYGTKVYGLRALFKALPPKQLKHLVVFSSLAGFHGNRGQADYALANEVLNKTVHVMNARFPSCDARALDFGPWGGGMVTPQLQKMFEDQGVEIIPRTGGAITVANVLFSTNNSQALFGNWGIPPAKPLEGTVKVHRTCLVAGSENKFLDSHKFKNRRVLPFTLVSTAMGQMAADTHPGYHLHSLQDIKLFRGFVAPDNENSMPMNFTLVDRKDENGKLEVEVTVTSLMNGKEVPSYSCMAILGARPRNSFSVEPLTEKDLAVKVKSSKDLYDNTTLFHGPDFQSITAVNVVTEQKVVAECQRVAVADQGQFAAQGAVDGFTLDTAFQLTLVSARVLKNTAALPNFAKSLDFYREIPVGAKFYAVLLRDGDGDTQKGDVVMGKHQFYFCDKEGKVYMGGRISVVLSAGLTW